MTDVDKPNGTTISLELLQLRREVRQVKKTAAYWKGRTTLAKRDLSSLKKELALWKGTSINIDDSEVALLEEKVKGLEAQLAIKEGKNKVTDELVSRLGSLQESNERLEEKHKHLSQRDRLRAIRAVRVVMAMRMDLYTDFFKGNQEGLEGWLKTQKALLSGDKIAYSLNTWLGDIFARACSELKITKVDIVREEVFV